VIRERKGLLFDFTAPPGDATWVSTDDVVMGGVSSSTIRIRDEGIAVFEGVLSLQHGGGFASVHCQLSPADLSGYDGLEMRVRGDGKRYRVRLRISVAPAVIYQAAFTTRDGVWESVRLPFESFEPTYRGQAVPDAPPLDVTHIGSFGWLIADRQAGQFRLEIDWVRAYVEEPSDVDH